MTSANDQRLETAPGLSRRLLAVLVGLLVSLALIVSGAAPALAQNAVGPQPVMSILAVGPRQAAAQTIVGVRGPPQLRQASATGVAADSQGGILSRVEAAASGDRGAIGREPVIGGEAANYGDDELAQFAFQHSGQGYANGEVRPSLDEIQGTISNGVRTRLPNQNAIRIQTPSVRVTINEDQPWKSTAYYR